jgi:two-component system LytT family sensor kinase
MNFRRPAVALTTFVVFTAIGVFFAIHQHLDDLLFNPGFPLRDRFLYELSGSWSAMLLMPFLNWVVMRWPLTWRTVWPVLGINIVTYAIYTVGHTSINAVLRFVMAPIFGVPHVELLAFFREMSSEAANDLVYFGMLMGTLYLINRFIETQELEAKLAEAKLENLRLQIQPHFLFNTLNAISTVMYEDVERADAMLTKLSDFLRTVLDSGSVHVVPLDEELAVERMYVDIMTTRLERKLNLAVDIAPDAVDSTVPFMLLQPLLENSIRHGMGSARSTLDLTILVARNNGQTVIHVDDDGLGFDPDARRGIGLQNVGSRLAYMYPDASTFTIAARPEGGTRATLTFPYQAKEH